MSNLNEYKVTLSGGSIFSLLGEVDSLEDAIEYCEDTYGANWESVDNKLTGEFQYNDI